MKGTVVIDAFPESAERYASTHAIVAVDVIRSTTTATTAVNLGKRVYPAGTTDEAFVIASRLENPLLVGEVGGNMPYGFDMTNSPVKVLSARNDSRPIVLVSSSGTQLIVNSKKAEAVYVSCLRNFSAVAAQIAGRHKRVALIGAGTRGQFRREDQIGCAWVAEKLIMAGYSCENGETEECVRRWSGVDLNTIRDGRSALYLKNSNQLEDLDFILGHIDDIGTVPQLVNGELVPAPLV